MMRKQIQTSGLYKYLLCDNQVTRLNLLFGIMDDLKCMQATTNIIMLFGGYVSISLFAE